MSTITRRSNGVTVIHVTGLHKISNAEAEELVSSFLGSIPQYHDESIQTAEDRPAQSGISSLSNSVIQQLGRMRRDLLGLPPLLRKRKAEVFEPVADTEMVDAGADGDEEQERSRAGEVDKNERKRLKKERRKQEKKNKAAS